MLKIALKGALARRKRFISTLVAVAIGVGFVAGVQIFSAGLNGAFNDLFASANQRIGGYVRSTASVEGDQGPNRHAALPVRLIDAVGAVDGVKAARGDYQGTAIFIKPDGKALTDAQGPPQLGLQWSEIPELNSFHIIEGHEPQDNDQVVIDKASSKRAKAGIGSKIGVITPKGSSQVTVVGIAKFGTNDGPLGASAVLFTPERAKAEFSTDNKPEGIVVVAQPGVSQTELQARIQKALPSGIEALTGEAYRKLTENDLKSALSIITAVLGGFAAVALVVSSFVIANTFSILVSQRTKELALFRAIGASRRQIIGSVTIEAMLVGLVGGVLGLGAGYGIANVIIQLAKSFGGEVNGLSLGLPAGTIVTSLVLGLVTTVSVSFLPARRAAKVPPVAAMRDMAVDSSASSKSRKIVGTVFVAIAVIALISSITSGTSIVFGIGMGALLFAVVAFGPAIARPVALTLGRPIQAIKKTVGRLARENAARNPRRTASSALALMIGAALVTLIAIFAQSIKSTINGQIDKSLKSDFTIFAPEVGLPAEVVGHIKSLPEVKSAVGIKFSTFKIGSGSESVVTTQVNDLDSSLDPHVVQGSLANLGPNDIAVDDGLLKDRGWKFGQAVPATFLKSGQVSLTVKAVYTDEAAVLGQQILANNAFFDANFDPKNDRLIFINKKSSASAEQAKSAVKDALVSYPSAKVNDVTGVKAQVSGQVNGLLTFVFGLLGFAVIIALFGIANTLSLSIGERTKEIGLLRAIGMTRSQVRSAVRWEAVIIAIFGAVLGVALGIFGGWALLRVLASDGSVTFALPTGQIVAVLIAAGAAGVLAALRPARRAAKLDILAAIATN